ncbi:MAG: ABC transporter permease [Candidatus Humimicrobiaceae bacterium]
MKKIPIRKIWKNYGTLVLFIAFFIFLSIASPVFFTVDNLMSILRQISILGLVSLGMLLVMVGGNIDLSVGSILGFTAVVTAKLSLDFGLFPAIIIGLLIAVTIGFVNGYFSTRGKGLSIMVTLSTKLMIYGGTIIITQTKPIINLPKGFEFFGQKSFGPISVPVIFLVLVIIIIQVIMSNTIFGRRIYAVGGNDVAAKFSGISIKKMQISTFIIAAVLSMIGGLILTSRVASAQPNAGFGMEMDVIGAVLLGGASLSGGSGTVRGTIIGVLIFGLINNGLNLIGVDPLLRDVIKGAIILFAILSDQWGKE